MRNPAIAPTVEPTDRAAEPADTPVARNRRRLQGKPIDRAIGEPADEDGLLAKPAILELTSFSDTTLWRRVRDGSFPAPVRISANRIAWRRRDVAAWVQSLGTVVTRRA
jgi:prophage regulatory protein